jgi:HIP---CoA ligase
LSNKELITVFKRADLEFGTIPAMILDSASRFGSAEAIVDDGLRRTFRQVGDDMVRVARALIASGIEKGDRVVVWAPNSAMFISAAAGILATGAWLVPMNTRFRGDEAAYLLRKSDASMLFTTGIFLGIDYLEMVRSVDPDIRTLKDAVILPDPGESTSDSWEAFLARGDTIDPSVVFDRIASLGPEDCSDIIFTSGTTGNPKGVMLRHGASLRAYSYLNSIVGSVEGDRVLIGLPFYHCFGYKAGWMMNLMSGSTTVLLSVFDPVEVMTLIETEKITHMPGSPTMFWSILDSPRRATFDLSTFRATLVAASSVPTELIDRIRDELGLTLVITGYGITENHAGGAATLPGDPPAVTASTIGPPYEGMDVRVVDDNGNDVPQGESGEMLFSGYGLMSGYFDDPEATAQTIVDGWLHTGDIVSVDETGYIHFVDRKKDMVIVGGFNVASLEVEKCLLGLEEVSQVAVTGMPDHHFGEVVAAFVVSKPGLTLTSDAVIAYAKVHMANFKVPRYVEIVSQLPVNGTGKVLKRELRDQLLANAALNGVDER